MKAVGALDQTRPGQASSGTPDGSEMVIRNISEAKGELSALIELVLKGTR
jgi:hypothetical protein